MSFDDSRAIFIEPPLRPFLIGEVAFALGFVSPSSFSYAFGRATGITPLRFRQRHLRKHI